MEKEKMLQIAIPAIAVAAIVLVVALIINGASGPAPEATKPGTGAIPLPKAGKKTVAEVPASADGVGTTKPDVNAPEWRDVGDGLKTWDVVAGGGEVYIVETDEGLWHYTGWLPSGIVFDSSLRLGDPISFLLAEVIKGWTRGLAGMKPGGVRRLYIPSALAYGPRGQGKDIPPNTDLVFEVKLLRISR